MNTTVSEVYLVTIPARLDPHYAFALREDAEKFVAALGHDEYELVTVPLIPGGGAGQLIEQELEAG